MNFIDSLRQFRILDYALFDLALAFLGMLLLSPLLSWLFNKIKITIPKKSWVIWAIPIGFITHLLIGRQTLMTERLLDLHGHSWLKILVLVLTVIGFKGVGRIKPQKQIKQRTQTSV